MRPAPLKPTKPAAVRSKRPSQAPADNSNPGRKRKHDEIDTLDEIETPVESWSQLTTVLVGPRETPFQVYTHYLRRIPFFKARLDADHHSGCIKMPEEDPQVFSHVLSWLYSNQLPIDWVKLAIEVESTEPRALLPDYASKAITEAVMVYITARKLQLEGLQNYILTSIFAIVNDMLLSERAYAAVVSKLPEEDGLRKLLSQKLAELIKGWGGWRALKTEGHRIYAKFASQKVEHMGFVLEALTDYEDGGSRKEFGSVCDLHTHVETPKCNA